jgi:hypothetical protein
MAETAPKTEIPKAPKGLRAAGRRFWREIHSEYDFGGSPELVLLVEEASRTADVVARLQAVVDEAETLRTKGSRNQDVAIPELDALRAYRAQYAALIRQLELPLPIPDDDGPGEERTTPMSRSEAGRKAAAERWGQRYGTR